MNAINTTPDNNTTSQPIGTISVVNGTVQAQAAANGVRTLQVGSPVFLNDRIMTGDNGMISIVFGDAARTQLDLGRMSDVVLNEDTLQYALPEEFSDAVAEVDQIQEALLTGTFDPTTDLEPTAAGPAAAAGPASDGGGSSYVEFSLTGEAVTPTSGAETTGVGLDFLDPPISALEEPIEPVPEQPEPVTVAAAPAPTPTPTPTDTPIIPPPPPPPDFSPSAGEFSSIVEERGLSDGTDGPDSLLTTTNGTFADLGIDFGGNGAGSVNFSNGSTTVTVVLDGNHATTTSLTGTYGTLTIFGDSTWQYEITDNTIDHSDNTTADGDGTTGAADTVPDIFTFTVFDADGDSASGTLTIDIYDDGPVATGALLDRVVEEEELDNFSEGSSPIEGSDGNPDDTDGPEDATQPDATVITGSLSSLVDMGADNPGTFGITLPPGLPALSSQGGTITYELNGTTLEAWVRDSGSSEEPPPDTDEPISEEPIIQDRLIFTFDVQPDGTYTFTLLDQLDHVSGDGENTSLTLVGGGSIAALSFGNTIIATDADGDPTTFAPEALQITIVDDVPILIPFGETQGEFDGPSGLAFLGVQEDALGNATLNSDNYNDDDDSSTGNLDHNWQTDHSSFELSSLVKVGADENLTWSLTPPEGEGEGEEESLDYASSLTSKGETVYYHVDGNTLTGYTGTLAEMNIIFTFTVDPTTGHADFNLNDQLDHSLGVSGSDDETLQITDLGDFVNATDFDGDSVNLAGRIWVSVENDLPTIGFNQNLAYGAVQEDALGNELVDDAADDIDSSTGNLDTVDDTDTATLNLAELLATTPGADNPASIDYSIKLDNPVQSNYTSNGQEVWYYEEDGKLVARSGDGGNAMGTVVFTFAVDASTGVATFDLDDQLDHSGNENDDELLAIDDLGSYVEANITDADNDTVSLNFAGKITVNVENDLPTIGFNQNLAYGAVQEDALGNEPEDPAASDSDSSTGNLDDSGVDTDTATLNLAELLDTTPGADNPASIDYSIKLDNPVQSNYTSNGQEVWYYEQDGKLVARSGDGGNAMGTVVFTFAVDAGTGVATFDLDDQLDHSGNEDDDELLAIDDLGSYVEANITDADGDTLSLNFEGKITVNVENDIPQAVAQPAAIVGTVLEDGLSEPEDGSEGIRESGETIADDEDSGSSNPADASNLANLFDSGADESLIFGISTDPAVLNQLDTLYSQGDQLYYLSDGTTLEANTEADGSGRFVFSLEVNSDGSWNFDLKDQLDHVDDNTNSENWALEGSTATAGSIDFSSVITATDADGDTTTGAAPNSFRVEVQDDIPEAASTSQVPGNMNLVLILDNSGSMYSNNISFGGGTVTRAEALQASVVAMLTSLATDGDAGSIYKVHIVEYNTDSAPLGTFTITGGDAGSAAAAIAAIEGMNEPNFGDVYTNYEAGYQQALQWVNSGDPLTDADVDGTLVNQVLFISDGDPNRWNDPDMGQPGGPDVDGSGGSFNSTALNEVTGSDGSNEITELGAWADSVRAIGLAVSDDGIDNNNDQDDRLDTLDLTGNALNITSGDQLLAALPELLKVTAPIISANVEEDDMTVDGDAPTDPDGSTGINEDGSSNADEASGSTVSTDATNLANLFITDADEELTYSISSNLGSLPTLYSGGTALTYGVTGNTLTASAGAETIFTFTVDPDGSWTFDLDGQLDHVAGNGENFELRTGDGSEETSSIDLSSIIVATDADGDEVTANTGAFVVNVQDDVPVINQVANAFIANEPGLLLTGLLDVDDGADESVSADLSINIPGWDGTTVKSVDSGLTSQGQTVYYYVDPADISILLAITDLNDPEGSKVFSLTVEPQSDEYEIETFGKLDAIKEYDFDAGQAGFPNGPKPMLIITQDPNGHQEAYTPETLPNDPDLQTLFTLTAYNGNVALNVNGSTDGMGIGHNNVVNEDEGKIVIDFGSSGLDGTVAIDDITFSLKHIPDSKATAIQYTAYNEDGDPVDLNGDVIGAGQFTGEVTVPKYESSFTINEDGSIGTISKVELEAVDENFKLTGVEFVSSSEEFDIHEQFEVAIVDSDGDAVTTTIDVEFDNNNEMTGTDDAEVFVGGPEDETISGEGGDDIIAGGAGNDTIEGGAGDDVIYGDEGNDELSGGAGEDQLVGGEGEDSLEGGEDDDTLVGDDVEFIGDPADPVIVEDEAPDIIDGGAGNDTAGDQTAGAPANDDTITTVEINTTDIDTLVPPPDDEV
ncbi:MAG: hypothetical protein A2X81_10400 [Desulfobacterales bacterium GWB2_56_26]|nr:MAG: hypothetical protein A2X81_10400 [Desulfobacterales bacterium GWB2_56_26]